MNEVSQNQELVISNLSYEELAKEAPALREKINRFRSSLGQFFVDKQKIIDLMTLCAVAQEPLLLVGPPGTAKSDLILKFKDAMSIQDSDYFEYMLTRFSEPSEIIGPIDINLLRQGKYIRRDQGKLPTAQLVFLDEIFKSNSAILNCLLTIINERKFYQDGVAQAVDLKILFAATNEIPEHSELLALKDRFCLKISCDSVQEDHFMQLIDAGLDAKVQRDLNQQPWVQGHGTLTDFLKAHRYLSLQMSRLEKDMQGNLQRDRHRFFSDELLQEMRRIIKTLSKEDGIFVSDRKIVKLYSLIRTHAWIFHGGAVQRQDLELLAYLGESIDEIKLLEEKVPKLLGLF